MKTILATPKPSPARRTQAQRIARSEHEIIHAAVSLIALKGPTDWTLAEIGRNAGYTGGLVSHRFGSKNGLLLAVTDRIVALFIEKNLSNHAPQKSSPQLLLSFFKLYIAQLQEGSDLFIAYHRLMAESQSTLPQLRPAFEKINVRLRSSFVSAIKQGQQDGSINPDLDPVFEAYSFTALFRGITNLWLTGPRDINLEAYAKYECKKILQRLRP